MASCSYCPTDCTQQLVKADFLESCSNPLEGGIDILVIAPLDDAADLVPLTTANRGTLATWTGNIVTTGSEDTTWNIVTVYGAYTSAQNELVTKGKHCSYSKLGTHNLTLRVCNARSLDNDDPKSYELLRKLQCGSKVRIWFGNAGVVFGGETNFEDGIEATVVNAGVETGDTADDAITEFVLSFSWKGCLPTMIQNGVFAPLIPDAA